MSSRRDPETDTSDLHNIKHEPADHWVAHCVSDPTTGEAKLLVLF